MKRVILATVVVVLVLSGRSTAAEFRTAGDGLLITPDYRGVIKWQWASFIPMPFSFTGIDEDTKGTISVIVLDSDALVEIAEAKNEGTITFYGIGTTTIRWSWESQQLPEISLLEKAFAYPNPSKGGISVKFALPNQPCQIQIFDQIGNPVWQGESAAGKAEWPLVNDHGQKVARGVYIYLITSDNGGKKIGKIAVIK